MPRLISVFSQLRADGSLATKMLAMKFDVVKFDGIINFGLYQMEVRDLLIKSRLHDTLKSKPTTVSDEDSA